MSEAVDTRVVEAKFDSKEFEKGVDRTVKKLDELKSSLNLKDSGKSVADLSSKIQEGTEKASNSLEKLQERFTSFTGMLKQKLLSGIADEIVGVFFKIKNGFESLVSSLSTAQIGVGMQRYTDILTSVRTLVSAGVSQSKAYDAIERLGEYADQTSYSLDSMVSTMSKFKTAGADINTAARMIEGLSNAAASMGVNAQQAERAYLNLQQAYSKKVMLQNDWISFESLPMVGTQFNQAIIDAAVRVGTLKAGKKDTKAIEELNKQLKEGEITQAEYDKMVEKAVTYQTVKKKGTKVRSARGITASNLGSNLASRWFTDEVMEEVFGNTYYFGEVGINEVNQLKAIERQLKAKYGDDEEGFNKEFQEELNKRAQERRLEKIKELDEALKDNKITQQEYNKQLKEFDKSNVLTVFGYNCFRAGQEARSFTDVLNTLKDAISRGWATSFELIFGKLDEAADFFTKLTESQLAEAIYAVGAFRNAILEGWNSKGGRDSMLSTLEAIDGIFGSIFTKMGLIKQDFDKDIYDQILKTQGAGKAQEYLYGTNYNKDMYEQILKEQGEAAAEAYKEAADMSPFQKAAEEISDRLYHISIHIELFFRDISKWLNEGAEQGESRLDRIKKVFDQFGKIVSGVFGSGVKVLEGSLGVFAKLTPIIDALWRAFSKLLDPIVKIFSPDNANGITIYTRIEEAFTNVGIAVEALVGKNGQDGPLTKIINVLGDVVAFFVELASSTVISNIEFFTDAFGLVIELLFGTSGQKQNEHGVIDGIKSDIESFGDACKTTFQAIHDFFASIIADVRDWLGLNNNTNSTQSTSIFQNITNWFNTNESFQKIKAKLDKFFEDIKNWFLDFPNKISEIGINIGDFFKSIFYTKKTYYVPTSVSSNGEITKWVKNDLGKWFDQALEDIKAWFNDLPNKVSNLGINIGDFFKSIFFEKQTYYVPTSVSSNGEITKWVKRDLTVWLEKAITDVWDWIKSIPSKLAKVPSIISEFFKGLFYKKVTKTYYIPTSAGGGGKSGKVTKISYVATPLKEWLDGAIKTVTDWIKDIPNKVKKLPSIIEEFFKSIFYTKQTHYVPTSVSSNGTMVTWVKKDFTTSIENFFTSVFDSIRDFISGINLSDIFNGIKDIGIKISNALLSIFTGDTDWTNNKNWLAEKVSLGIETIRTKLDEAWPAVRDFIISLPEKIRSLFDGNAKETEGESSPISTAILSFGQSIGNWVSQIPNTLLEFWKKAEIQAGTLKDQIIGWITGENEDNATALTEAQKKGVELAAHYGGVDAGKILEASYKKQNWRKNNPIFANLEDFFVNLKDYFIDKITHLPESIASGLATGADLLDRLLKTATGWINDENKNKNLETEVEFDVTVDTEDGKKQESGLLKSLSEFGQTIWRLITETIPGFISAGFEWVKTNVSTWIEGLVGLFNGGEDQIDAETISFGEIIAKKIRSIPDKIRETVEWVKKLFTKPLDPKLGERITSSVSSSIRIKDNNPFKKETEVVDKSGVKAIRRNFSTGLIEVVDEMESDADDVLSDFNIWDTIKEIGSAIGDAFADIGPDILKGLGKALEWVGNGIAWLTGQLSDALSKDQKLTDVVDEALNDPNNEEASKWAPLWEAVKSVGQTIWNILTKTIPDFISSAVSYIAKQVPSLLSGLFGGGAESGSESESGTGEIVEGIQQGVSESIITTEQLKEAQDKLEQLKAANEDYEEAQKEYDELYQRFLKQANSSNKKGHVGIISYAGAEEAVEQYNDVIDAVTNEIDGEEQLYKKEEALAKLKEKREALYEELNNYNYNSDEWQKTNDKIDALDERYNKIYDSTDDLFDISDIVGSSSDTTKSKKVIDNGTQLLTKLGDFVSTLGNTFGSDEGRTLAYMAIVLLILNAMRDMFSLTDELEALKGAAIGIAFAGLITLLGYITYIATQGTPEQAKRVMDLLNTLQGLLTTLAVIVGIWQGGKLASGIIDLINGDTGTSLVATSAKSSGGGLGFLGTLLGLAENAIIKPAEIRGIGDSILSLIEEVGVTFNDVATDIAQAINNVVLFIEPTVDALNRINPKISTARATMSLVKGFLTDFIIDSSKLWLDSNIENIANSDGFYKNMSILEKVSSMVNYISVALANMKSLEDPVKSMSELRGLFQNTEFTNQLVGLANDIGNLSKDLELPDNIGSFTEFMANTFSIISNLTDKIPEIKLEELNKMFELLQKLVNETWLANNTTTVTNMGLQKWILGDTSLDKFGQVLSKFSNHLINVFTRLKEVKDIIKNGESKISDDTFSDYNKSIDLISNYAFSLFALSGRLQKNSVNLSTDTAEFKLLEEGLPRLGVSLSGFLNSLNSSTGFNEIGVDRFNALMESLKFMGETIGMATSYFESAPEKIDYIGTALFGNDNHSGFMQRLQEASSYWSNDTSFGGIRDFINLLYDFSHAIEVFYTKDENGNFNYLTGLQNMFSDDMRQIFEKQEINIVPVLTIDEKFEAEANRMHQLIGFDPNVTTGGFTNTMSINPLFTSDLLKDFKPIDYSSTLTEIKNGISTLGTDISNMQFVFAIDGKDLTEKIGKDMDRWLGLEGIFVARSNLTT